MAAINQGLAEAMINGLPPTDPKAMDLAEQHRNNERSGQNYDDMAPGLSQYVHDAIVANAERSD